MLTLDAIQLQETGRMNEHDFRDCDDAQRGWLACRHGYTFQDSAIDVIIINQALYSVLSAINMNPQIAKKS